MQVSARERVKTKDWIGEKLVSYPQQKIKMICNRIKEHVCDKNLEDSEIFVYEHEREASRRSEAGFTSIYPTHLH